MQIIRLNQPTPPRWARALVHGGRIQTTTCTHGTTIRVASANGIELIEAMVPRVRDITDEAFQQRVTGLYDDVFDILASRPPRHALRLWNFIPHIHRRCNDGRDRYMVFNAGRYEAYGRRFPAAGPFPASSAVGYEGSDFHLHVLAAAQAGRTLENPRQVPAPRYSRRYGPLPPLFSRGCVTRLSHPQYPAPVLLTAGTASIQGEDSCHTNDLTAQLNELCTNMDKLCTVALTSEIGHQTSAIQEELTSINPLALFQEVRAYVPYDEITNGVIGVLGSKCPAIHTLEVMRADICRPELLVEIEGLALLETALTDWGRRACVPTRGGVLG